MAPIPVTLLYGGLAGLLSTLLGVHVSLLRIKHKLYLGAQLPPQLNRAVRAHGNAAEYVAAGVVLMLVLELGGLGSAPLHALGGAFVLARVIHAAGLLGKSSITTVGATLNYVTLGLMSCGAIYMHFMK
jgi:uncharacterized protein